jgi:hypothetical protein
VLFPVRAPIRSPSHQLFVRGSLKPSCQPNSLDTSINALRQHSVIIATSQSPFMVKALRARGVTQAVARALPRALALPGHALTARAPREDQRGRGAIASVLTHSKQRPLRRIAPMRASLLASAIASTLWRFFLPPRSTT